MQTTVVEHPLVAQRLTTLRAVDTPRPLFRQTLTELSRMLIYEALRDLQTKPITVDTPLAPADGVAIDLPPLLVPVLRAGLGMLNGAIELLPDAHTGFVGAKRDEETFQPTTYLNSVPPDCKGAEALVLDPMLATGGSAVATCELLAKHHIGRVTMIAVLSAPEGIERLADSGTVDRLFTAAVDERLNDLAYIVPGLGDAGDRQFGVFE